MQDNIIKGRFGLPSDLNKILVWALLLRIILFFIVINSADPFIISDDRAYEEISKTYLQFANGLWDWNAVIDTGGAGYLQVFWPYTICVFAKLFQTEYAGRILNIILSVLIIIQTYKLTYSITGKHERATFAAKLMAFLPYPLMFCVFNIKDFYIMLGTLYSFRLLVSWQVGETIKARQIVLCLSMLVGVYFARGGVVEFIGLVAGLFVASRFYKEKKYSYLALSGVVAIVGLFYMWDNIQAALDMKLENTDGVAGLANGLRMVQMQNPTEIYKIPLQYLFSMLSPFSLDYFGWTSDFSWSRLMGVLNVSLYPIAFGSLFYLFMRKHNTLFYYATFSVYIAITAMVLAISRHYFFLFFIHAVNFACFWDKDNKQAKNAMWACSAVLFVFVFILSLKGM